MAADNYSGPLTISRPVKTFEQLCDVFLPTVAARIWAACCWPKRMADGWNIGDYQFAVIEVCPEPKTRLYVQFWSEPDEEVLMEVCSEGTQLRLSMPLMPEVLVTASWVLESVGYLLQGVRRVERILRTATAQRGSTRVAGKVASVH